MGIILPGQKKSHLSQLLQQILRLTTRSTWRRQAAAETRDLRICGRGWMMKDIYIYKLPGIKIYQNGWFRQQEQEYDGKSTGT